jgi:hypothetical protein
MHAISILTNNSGQLGMPQGSENKSSGYPYCLIDYRTSNPPVGNFERLLQPDYISSGRLFATGSIVAKSESDFLGPEIELSLCQKEIERIYLIVSG